MDQPLPAEPAKSGASLSLRRALEKLLAQREPGLRVVQVRELAGDADVADSSLKASGYGTALRVTCREASGRERQLVLHLCGNDEYGHDRRSDRAASLLLAYDSYGRVPGHARAVDVGMLAQDGSMISLAGAGEPYLLTEWASGQPYAEDLRAIGQRGCAIERDERRLRILAATLARLHVALPADANAYRRAMRDWLGHGEGVFGIIDGYPSGVPAAPPQRLHAIERACLDWRWLLRDRSRRLCRTHGDFHPFNVLFDEQDRLALLDASRGSIGDAADDVAAMAINYVFFALERPGAWRAAFSRLWHGFFEAYLARRDDPELLSVIAPFIAWRALVLASPRWYPLLSPASREALLSLAEAGLSADRFDPRLADELFNES